ncbi:MAG TPA: hypothetical protein VNE63_14070 [Candidatus Acidoferrales bacterium]|nr:hypothetical protein [Candidatus Acidoferrales bacterium]
MKRTVSVAALALLAVAPLFAQAPKGWKLRVDRSTNASDPDAAGAIKFITMGSGFRALNPQAAVYWNPANAASGNYTLKGTFTLIKSTGHDEYYGLVFGGSALDGAEQSYLYFMVTDDGTWLVKRRTGNTAESVSEKTSSAAVKKPDANGTCTNALEVRVMADKIAFVVNGTVVSTMPKAGPTAKTDGIYGIRINHHLEVQINGFGLSKL